MFAGAVVGVSVVGATVVASVAGAAVVVSEPLEYESVNVSSPLSTSVNVTVPAGTINLSALAPSVLAL